MPFDDTVHAKSRQVNKDGTWKAQRGKTAEAKAARAAFKASGGDVTAPDAVPGLPGTKSDDAIPGLPGAENIPEAPPISMAEFTAKATAVLKSGKVDNAGIVQIYLKATGQIDAGEAAKMLGTNESMRRTAVDMLTEIELSLIHI